MTECASAVFIRNVRKALDDQGRKRGAFERKCRVSVGYLVRANGSVHMGISLEIATRMAKELRISIEDLINPDFNGKAEPKV